jgi:hypothetical protein
VITLTSRWGYNNNRSGVIICQTHENQIIISLRKRANEIIKVNILNYFLVNKKIEKFKAIKKLFQSFSQKKR